jgi:O-antigen/teichoic acid export membrane protein
LGEGATYLYIETIVGLFLGFILWIVLANIVTPEIIGNSSTVISFSTIFATIGNFGVPIGVSHLLGKSLIEHRLEYSIAYVKTSVIIVLLGILATSSIILILRNAIYFLDLALITLSILIVGTTCMATLFRYIVIATLDTKKLPVIILVSSGTKIILTIVLVLVGNGVIGITMGYLSYYVISCFLLCYTVMAILKTYPKKSLIKYRTTFKSMLLASVPNWIPALIAAIGSGELGLIILFGSSGARQAGSFFLAYAIYEAMAAICYSLFTIALPLLSGMDDSRKRLTAELIKMSLIFSMPITCSIIMYSYEVMRSFGTGYTDGSTPLQILLLTLLPFSFFIGVTTLVYSYGNYRQVLLLGLASALPRTLLYFALAGPYGATGVAISYAAGTIIGFIVSISIAKKIKFRISWQHLSAVMAIPLGISFTFNYFNVYFIPAILATTVISYMVFMKLKILKRNEVEDTLNLLPENIAKPMIKIVNLLGMKLNPEY